MHALAILRAYVRIGLLNFMQYRADFFVAIISMIIEISTQILGLVVIFNQTDTLKGWSQNDLLIIIGIQSIVNGLISVIIRPSLAAFMESIRLGTFDFLLTKPADAQLLASIQSTTPQALTPLIIGIGIVIAGLVRGGDAFSITRVGAFLLLLAAGCAMVYAFMLFLSSLAFWFVKVDNIIVIFDTMFGSAGQWPITIFPTWMRLSLTFIVPVAFAVTIPAQALTGRLTWNGALLAIGLALAFLIAVRLFWRTAIRHYTGASA